MCPREKWANFEEQIIITTWEEICEEGVTSELSSTLQAVEQGQLL